MRGYNENFHPTGPWLSVGAGFYGEGEGECVVLEFRDKAAFVAINLHYGSGDPVEFVELLKSAVARLSVPPEKTGEEEDAYRSRD